MRGVFFLSTELIFCGGIQMKDKIKFIGFILVIITIFYASEDVGSGGDPPAEPYLFMTDTYRTKEFHHQAICEIV